MFSFSRGLCAGFTFNRHVVFRKPRDNREITVTCSAKYAILTELNLQVSRNCVGDSSTARFKKDDKKRFAKIPVSRLFRQFAETLRKLHGNSARDSRPQRGKNAKPVDSRVVEQNWSLPTAPDPVLILNLILEYYKAHMLGVFFNTQA